MRVSVVIGIPEKGCDKQPCLAFPDKARISFQQQVSGCSAESNKTLRSVILYPFKAASIGGEPPGYSKAKLGDAGLCRNPGGMVSQCLLSTPRPNKIQGVVVFLPPPVIELNPPVA